MYLIVTRSFPPEVGGMQSLMWGLAKEMSKNFMVKVFADHYENHKEFDKKENFSIERVGGIKFLRKIRKAQLINEYLKESKVQGIIADHWKSLELINTDKKKYCLIHGKEINHPKGSSLNKRIIKVLNNVDLPVLGSPSIPTLSVLILLFGNYILFYKSFYEFLCCFFLCYLKTLPIAQDNIKIFYF